MKGDLTTMSRENGSEGRKREERVETGRLMLLQQSRKEMKVAGMRLVSGSGDQRR